MYAYFEYIGLRIRIEKRVGREEPDWEERDQFLVSNVIALSNQWILRYVNEYVNYQKFKSKL